LLPTKLIGIVADHGSFPIERIAIDQGGEGRWVGSAGHEEVLKLTDLREVFEDEGEKDEKKEEEEGVEESSGGVADAEGPEGDESAAGSGGTEDDVGDDALEDEEWDKPKERKRKRGQEKDPLVGRKKKGKNEIDAEPSFFSEL
jgi:hypothetical protein